MNTIVRIGAALNFVARWIDTAAMLLSALAVAVTTAIVCAEVVLRSAFGISTLISAEYAGYLLAATVYLGMSWTFRNGGFIRVELLHNLLEGRIAAILNFLLAGIGTVILVVYTYYIFHFVSFTYASGATSIFITRTPLWMPQIVLPIGSALLTGSMFATMVRAGAAAIWPERFRIDDHAAEDFL